MEYELWPELVKRAGQARSKSSRLEYELWPEHQCFQAGGVAESSRLEYELWPKALAGLALRT